jgi:chromosome segregation ATPase
MPSKQSKLTTVNSNQNQINETDNNFNTSTSNTYSKIKPTANTELLDTFPSLNKLFKHLNKESKTNQRTKNEIEKLAQNNTINERMTNKEQPQDNEKAINDSFDSIDKNQGSVYEMKTVNRSKISRINIDITSLSNNISKIIAKLNLLDIKVTKIERNLQNYENQNDDIVEVKGKLAELESNTLFLRTLYLI